MKDNRPRILGVPVDALSMDEAINKINEAILNKEKLHIVTINAEMVMMTQTDKEFNEILQRSKMLIPDGSGIVIALKKYGQNISRLPGVELARQCVKSIKGNIFLFGANETVISTAYENLKKLSGSSNLVG
ncbi:MAG: WecB/TagA/CpsF family glycosyltransferase, partial [Candidatus Sericytochromatia bacterium]